MECTRSAATATTGAGLSSATETYKVQIDSVPAAVGFSNGPDQSVWATSAQSIDVTATKPVRSARRGADHLHPEPADDYLREHWQSRYRDGPDHRPAAWWGPVVQAQDNAGNWSAPHRWSFLIDNTTPTGEFLAPNPSDPTQVAVQVADAGFRSRWREIEIQTASGWQPLPRAYDADAPVSRPQRSRITAPSRTAPTSSRRSSGTSPGNEATITQDRRSAAGPRR